jgi:hypothetical protein
MGSHFDGLYCWISTHDKETRLNFVVVDTLWKSALFILVRTTYHVRDIARDFVNEILILHGVPRRIISSRGSMFIGWF